MKVFLLESIYVHYVCVCAPGNKKKASGGLELKIQMFVSHHERAGNQNLVFSKSNKYS